MVPQQWRFYGGGLGWHGPLRNFPGHFIGGDGGGVGWGGLEWGEVRDLYHDAILLYLIPLLIITLSIAFVTSFILAVVLNSEMVISLH